MPTAIRFNNFDLKYKYISIHKSTMIESSDGYYYKMRDWQERNFDIIKDEKYFGIIAPTGSGKSLLISAISYDFLMQNTKYRVIIAVPQINIGSGYITTRFINSSGNRILLSPEYAILNRDNTCNQFDDFINDKNPSIDSRICICSYNTLNSWYEKNGIDKLKDLLLWIDENHHLRSATSKYDTEMITYNTLAKVVTDMFPYNRIGLSTATFFRGDGHSLLPPDILNKFKIVRHNYDEYFEEDCNYITSFKSYTILYTGEDHKEAVLDIISKDPKKPTVVYLPPVEHHNPHRKRDYINHLKDNLSELKIIDIADNRHEDDIHTSYTMKQAKGIKDIDKNNQIAKAYHFAKPEERAALPKPDIDLIISQNLMKEGTDYLPLERVIIIGNRKAVGGNIQMIGRCLRDYVEKQGRDLEIYFVVQRFNPDLSEDQDKNREIINSNLNILWQNMILEEMFTPNLKYIKNRKALEKVPSISIWEETFGDQFVEIRKDIQTEILNTLPIGEGVTLTQQWEYFEQIVKSNLPERIEPEVVDRLVKSLKLRQQISGYKYRHPGIDIDMDLISDISPLDCIETYIHLSFDVDNIQEYRINYNRRSNDYWIDQMKLWKINHPDFEDIPTCTNNGKNESYNLGLWCKKHTPLNNPNYTIERIPLSDMQMKQIEDIGCIHYLWDTKLWIKYRVNEVNTFILTNNRIPVTKIGDSYESKLSRFLQSIYNIHSKKKLKDEYREYAISLLESFNILDITKEDVRVYDAKIIVDIIISEFKQTRKYPLRSNQYYSRYTRIRDAKRRSPVFFNGVRKYYSGDELMLFNILFGLPDPLYKYMLYCVNLFNDIILTKNIPKVADPSKLYDILLNIKGAKRNRRLYRGYHYYTLCDDIADIYGLSGIFDHGFKLDITKLRKPSQEEIDLILNKYIEEEKV